MTQTSAWKIKHKLKQVMLERDASKRLIGRIEIDDAYLGGERSGGKRGRGAPGKTPFVAFVVAELKARKKRAVILSRGYCADESGTNVKPLNVEFDVRGDVRANGALVGEILDWAEAKRIALLRPAENVPIAYAMLGEGTLATSALESDAARWVRQPPHEPAHAARFLWMTIEKAGTGGGSIVVHLGQ